MTILQDVKAAAAADAGKEPPTEKKDDAAPTAEEQISEAETRTMASLRGWVPKAHFKGDPDKWVDAKTFLDRAENELPLLKARNRKLEKQAAETHALLKRVVADQKAQRDRAVDQAVAKLKAEKKEAVKEGDVDKVEAIDEKIDRVKASAKDDDEPAVSTKKGEVPEEFTEWVGKNKWFKESPRMRKYAEGVWDELKDDEDFSELPLADQLKRIGKEVRVQFPDKFTKPKEAPAVESGSNGTGRSGGGAKTYADLPPEAKAICDDLIAQKVIKSRADYVKEYQW